MKRLIACMAVGLAAFGAFSQTAEELMAKIDANRTYASIKYSARMVIRTGKITNVKTMKAWSDGTDKAFIEFTNPEDRGVRMLKLGKDLWMYFPKEQDTVKISGHLLKEGMMGSDVSYEDALESDSVASMYSASITGKEDLEGRSVYVLELKATNPKAKYDRRVLRVDTERYIVLMEEMYARSGKLLKTTKVLEAKQTGKRWFPVSVEISDKLRRDSSTTFAIEDFTLDAAMDASLFTRSALEK